MRIHRRKRASRRAFTLLEMLLTMAVLVALASVFWPMLLGLRQADSLDRSVDDLRGLLAGMRLRAIQEGTLYTMTLQPETGSYRIAGAEQAAGYSSGDGERVEFDSAVFVGDHQLEPGLRFSPVQQAVNASDQAGEITIEFFPDGTATDATFLIVDSQEIGRLMRVRGLTGLVSAGDPFSLAAPAQSGGRR